MSRSEGSPSVAILGGGIAGLSAALKIHESRPSLDWTLFESEANLGGVLQTTRRDGWLIERAADNFLTREPSALELCRRIGIEEELLETNPHRRRALVVNRGRVARVPEGFVLASPRSLWPTLTSSVLSLRGKLRLACEPLIPRRPKQAADDESVARFASRRLGREAFERLVQPLVAGIYTADPEKLSMEATLPQFLRQEEEHGSLWRAARRSPSSGEDSESGARYGLFLAPREGMHSIVETVSRRLPEERIRCGTRVLRVEKLTEGWNVVGPDNAPLGRFDAVILAVPSYRAAELLSDAAVELSQELAAIEYAGVSIVCLGVREDQVTRPIDGFGFVAPIVERRRIVATSFSSYKFPDRSPEGRLLIRVFVGGALQAELAELPDKELIRIAQEELADLVGLRGEAELTEVARWPRRMPQYHVGHLDRVDTIERLAECEDGLELAGAAYRGVGVPQCVRSGEHAAMRVLDRLRESA